MSEAPAPLSRRLIVEALGTAILVATVVGSGIMAERLAGGNQAIALLGNTIPTGAILVVIITIFGPISGAHFNPAVTLVFATRGETPWSEVIPYIAVQLAGGIGELRHEGAAQLTQRVPAQHAAARAAARIIGLLGQLVPVGVVRVNEDEGVVRGASAERAGSRVQHPVGGSTVGVASRVLGIAPLGRLVRAAGRQPLERDTLYNIVDNVVA